MGIRTLGYNPEERGIIKESASDEAIQYLQDRLSGKRKTSLQQDIGYKNLFLPQELLEQFSPVQRKIMLNTESLVREVRYFYSTYVQ